MPLSDLQLAALAAVAQLDPDAYGVSVRDRIAAMWNGRRPSLGSVYTTLEALEAEGLIRSWLGEPIAERGGRAKRLFAVSATGARALAKGRQDRARILGSLAPDWQPE
jgi:PadR family transcriptional regulator PadR